MNEQVRVDADKFEDYDEKIRVPKHFVEEFGQFERHDELNFKEIKIINQ